jgi:hypothetical protein
MNGGHSQDNEKGGRKAIIVVTKPGLGTSRGSTFGMEDFLARKMPSKVPGGLAYFAVRNTVYSLDIRQYGGTI